MTKAPDSDIEGKGWRRYWFPVLAFFAVLGLTFGCVWMLEGDGPWNGMEMSRAAEGTYCEWNDFDSVVRQPANSWSNLVYLGVGLLLLHWAWRDRRFPAFSGNPIRAFPGLTFLLGFSYVFLFFGSFLFHASLTRIGQRLDMTATYSLMATLLAIAVYRAGAGKFWQPGPKLKTSIMIGLVVVYLGFFLFKWYIHAFYAFPVLIFSIMLTTRISYQRNKPGFRLKYPLLALPCIAGAGLIRELDVAKVGCDPDSILQGHALWHGLTAAAGLLVYLFYRDEARGD